ncbi:MAG: glycine zipper 2TM domain-containing protein [Gemmatirosa sp.]|nr:glycine zipper 2TM domain-containing protein [Gemmatirosa sp.]
MSTTTRLILAPAIALLAACGGQKAEPKLDDALQNDLSLASQAQAYRQQQIVSPQELGAQPYGQPGMYPNGYVPQPLPVGYAPGPYYAPAPVAAAPQTVERTRVVYRDRPSGGSRGSASGSGNGGSGVVYRAPAQTVKKNTKRDAAIGAVAGAAIGVATSARKDRLKGGLLGAVAGSVLGAVVGNNVDKQHVPY